MGGRRECTPIPAFQGGIAGQSDGRAPGTGQKSAIRLEGADPATAKASGFNGQAKAAEESVTRSTP
jgi:hypothetical protein